MVKIFNRRIKKETIKHFGFQSILAGIIFYLGLNLLPILADEFVLVAAAGSSAFVVFAMPSSKTADPRRVIGSHFVCGLIGFAFHFTHPNFLSFEVAVSVALIVSILVMVSLWLEHPPAGGTVIFFVINAQPAAFISLLLLVTILALFSHIFEPYLYDLV
ncbi:MAG: HPP family protein [Candidatus Thermoplasmatota archaeon]|nr:HPP family protein [Candidatus Thermoplasmatota archaeon]